jgi:hypothetical protein
LEVLLEEGALVDGQDLWLRRYILRKGRGDGLEDDDRRLRFRLKVAGGIPRVLYQPIENGEIDELAPSKARDRVLQELQPGFKRLGARAVHDTFSTEPGGKTLGELAAELDLWS